MNSRMHPRNGFTLVEVITAVVLMVFMSGALFALLSSVLEARVEMTERIRKQNRLIAWDQFFRSTLEQLETECIILTEEATSSGLATPGYKIRFTNATVKLGPYAEYTSDSSFILETVEGDQGSITLQLIPYPEMDETGLLGAVQPPLTLIEGITRIRFEFYNAFSNEWSEEWQMSNQKPHAIKNHITLRTGESHEMIVWIPHA